jgi:hypothetical protein
LRRQFDEKLAENKIDKIFKTIPAHVFFDIKKPLSKKLGMEVRMNQYNQTRQHYVSDFFDLRA